MTQDLERSVKDKIRSIAQAEKRTINDVWKQFILERFLVRLGKSKYTNALIFKGGRLLANYVTIGRETVDLDFLARNMKATEASLITILKEIAQIEVSDGVLLSHQKTEVLSQPHMPYPGFRFTFQAKLGRTKTPFLIDVGSGDIVEPLQKVIILCHTKKGPIFEPEIILESYPPETIFAEKLEAMLRRRETNSRMKDFHDLLVMTRTPDLLNIETLRKAIQKTFSNRETDLDLPISFRSEELSELQKYWMLHHRSLGDRAKIHSIPPNILEDGNQLNDWFHKQRLED